jgi:hypothetical protein
MIHQQLILFYQKFPLCRRPADHEVCLNIQDLDFSQYQDFTLTCPTVNEHIKLTTKKNARRVLMSNHRSPRGLEIDYYLFQILNLNRLLK